MRDNFSVKLCKRLRPGLAKPMIMPVRLRKQNDMSMKTTEFQIAHQGRTLVGAPQFVVRKLRPGLARPALIAKSDMDKAEKMVAQAEGASEAAATMQPKANGAAAAHAAEASKVAKAAAGLGWWK